MRAISILSFLFLFFATACHKGVQQPTDPCGSVEGILWTDVNGAVVYAFDSTDWQTRDTWCPEVEALFADRPPVVLDTTPPDSLFIRCFPNPTGSLVQLAFTRDDTSYVDLRFVNDQFQLVQAFDSLTMPAVTVVTDSLYTPVGELVRVYYRVVHTDGTAHRGHGDIEIGE